MAVVADRVIVELEAKLDRYDANVRRAEARFDSATRSISANSAKMARDIERNSKAAGNSIRNLAATFAAGFTVQRVAELADGYTRFTNSLKVAGVEGSQLARVQENLFGISQKYGVELEGVGTLYSRLAQTSKELGATQADLLKFTNGVGAALKVAGGSAASSQGALLQLSQALGGAVVRAEEFNSINEGARPILQAVATGITRFGGSVAKLRAEVIDGKVTSQEFFRGFLSGSAALEAQASKANLTIAASFTILNNALGKFIGETDDSLSATERVSAAVIKLSENLDTVAAALGVIGAVLLGRFAAGMVASAASTGLATTALFALQARAAGAATTMEALALTSATAGRSLLAAFGGPIGVTVAALALGIYYLSTRTDEAAEATAKYRLIQSDAANATNTASDAAERLATAHGKAREEALALARAERENIKQKLASAQASLLLAEAEATRAAASAKLAAARTRVAANDPRLIPAIGKDQADTRAAQADANVRAAETAVISLSKAVAKIDKAIAAGPPPVTAARGKPTKPKKGPKSPKATDPDEVARRFADDLARGQLDYEQAMADVIGTLEVRAQTERTRIAVEEESRAREINANKDYSAAQKAQLLELNKQIANARREAVNVELLAAADEQAAALKQADLQNARDIAEAQARNARTLDERRAAELRILDLQYQEERARLEAVIANKRISEADREIARRRLAALGEIQKADEQAVKERNAGPLADYLRSFDDPKTQIEQAVVEKLRAVDEGITDAVSKRLGVKDPFLKTLLKIFIEQAVLKPIYEAVSASTSGAGGGAGGGIKGFFANVIGAVLTKGKTPGTATPARASGGHVNAGQLYRINETGVEGFRPAGSGQIIPLGRMNRAGGANITLRQTVNVDARGSVNPDGYAEHIRASVREETVQIVGSAVRGVNKGVPGRLRQWQTDEG